jgi:hypothetical protein
MVFFEVRKEFPEVAFHGLAVRAELPTDFIRDPGFGVAKFQEFKDARAEEVQPIHLPLADVEEDGAVLVMGRANLFR